MRNIRISGKMKKVFVLRETDENLVYISLDSIQRIDYDRLLDIESRGGDMLNEMRKTKLDNGMNSLAVYDDVIQVLHYANEKHDTGIRVPKPEDGRVVQERYEQELKVLEEKQEKEKEENKLKQQSEPTKQETEVEKPKRRGPGRPPKNEKKESQSEE